MITVLDVNGNHYQLPVNQVRTIEDLKIQLLSLFQLSDHQFDIFFNKKQLNLKSPLPPNNTEHPFIIVSKPDRFTSPKFSSQNLSKGRFDHLFLKNSIIPSEHLYDDFSPHLNSDSGSSSNSDNMDDIINRNSYFPFHIVDDLGNNAMLNDYDFLNFDDLNTFLPDSYSQDSLDEINLSLSDENRYDDDDDDDEDESDDDEMNEGSTSNDDLY